MSILKVTTISLQTSETIGWTYDDWCLVKNDMCCIHWIRWEYPQSRLDAIAQHILELEQNHQHQDEHHRQDGPYGHASLGIACRQRTAWSASVRFLFIISIGIKKRSSFQSVYMLSGSRHGFVIFSEAR